ncbi:YbhB/YbcL family Raf kinase inhibitor-like protein [Hydrogenophaga luteola]|uniref:YbhB/YbcL family Raf kinase inhibitor-like protein n=1 Tax=Hydrogenophaga luteola TaxID=1591122 RepID=A0ABV7W0Z7_9BURK
MSTSKNLKALALASMTLGSAAFAQAPVFTLESPDLSHGVFETRFVANGFGCTGANVSPKLVWRNVPVGTKSLALTVHDPDAPTGSGFWHWAVYNLPPDSGGLTAGAGNAMDKLPASAVAGVNDFHDTGVNGGNGLYGGPCPPVGDAPHRYVFTLYALAVPDIHAAAGIPKTGSAALHSFVLKRGLGTNLLGKASFTARYGR